MKWLAFPKELMSLISKHLTTTATSSTSTTPAPRGTPPSLPLLPPSPPLSPFLSFQRQTQSICFSLNIPQFGTTGPPKMYRKMNISLVGLQV
ncbi:hypothetical protein AHAS_AhasUnG0039700 [Arachis hypogaea]